MRARRCALGALGALALTGPAIAAGASPSGASPAGAARPASDSSPVDLAAKVDTAAGKAAAAATVIEGDARFEVLGADVIRLEYSPSGSFLDFPTFDVLDRDLAVPAFTKTVQGGWLQLQTSDLVLRYKIGSGPFGPTNTALTLADPPPGGSRSVTPTWEWECTYGQVCQSGTATLTGGAVLDDNHAGYASPAGFVAGYTTTGAGASWQVLGSSAGSATVSVRYSNYVGLLGGPASRTMSLVVDGTTTQLTLPPTSSWDDWATVTAPVTVQAGTNTVALDCESSDDCNVNVDDLSVAPAGASPAPFLPAGQLGGYIRSFDSATYGTGPSCASGQSGDTCTATLPAEAPGLLDRAGWFLLDDTHAATWSSDGWLGQRPSGDVEDGYLFGYGQDFTGALADLERLTGPTLLPPEYVFGNWFSRYYAYSASDYEDDLLPEFADNKVTLDDLSIDTNWKSPNSWDGWEWNTSLFPDPSSFLSWAASENVHVTLNIHSSIATDDPQYSSAQSIAGNTLASSTCTGNIACAVWDWGQEQQAESNFSLQQPLQQQGVSFFWLDWCCDASIVSAPGVTPDSWINHLYAQQMVDAGERGFVLSRIGASYESPSPGSWSTGAWAEHRSTIHFTGDTWSTWNTLAFEAELTEDEAAVDEPYVSDDIGGFLGPPPGGPTDPTDLYLRWLQLGTFQPIMRLHSNGGDRLPWDYGGTAQKIGDQFMQLRESLVPYVYTLAAATDSGMPMARALYLDFPSVTAAYNHPEEYLFGPDVLVAPVTVPGTTAKTSVWFPPGRWIDWFTGVAYTGPTTRTLTVPLDEMPVFVQSGGIVPLQPSDGHADTAGSAALTLRVFAGADGSFSLYGDAGSGLGYESGQSTTTPISYEVASGGTDSSVIISPTRGSYAGAPTNRTYTVELVDISAPSAVRVDGTTIKTGWSYDATTHTLDVSLPAEPTSAAVTVTEIGGSATA